MKIQQTNFTSQAINNGGSIHPLIIDSKYTGETGLMNPSIYNDAGNLIVNIRHVNYTLYHSEKNKFQHQWGPLLYVHPENDVTLTTKNFIQHLEPNTFSAIGTYPVNMNFDSTPKWTFRGLEDARLFRWNEKLYLCGVRRDHIDNKGTGRMDLSEIELSGDAYNEISRTSIPAPDPNKSYCEKNWMPLLDKPFHWIKWTDPTELVSFDPSSKKTDTVFLSSKSPLNFERDIRGGSHILSWNEYYRVAITHEVYLHKNHVGRKNGRYWHRIVVWDQNAKLVAASEPFDFLSGHIEFVTGICEFEDKILISFGFQDNAAFILSLPKKFFDRIIEGLLQNA